MTSTLAWMWKHASIEVKGRCEQYRLSKAVDLPAIDATLIPADPKLKDDPALEKPTMVDAHKLNTSDFYFWPRGDEVNADIGDYLEDEPGEGDAAVTERRRMWMQLPMGMKDEEEHRWHGVKFLGEGSGGRVGLWVKTNEDNVIIDERILELRSKRN